MEASLIVISDRVEYLTKGILGLGKAMSRLRFPLGGGSVVAGAIGSAIVSSQVESIKRDTAALIEERKAVNAANKAWNEFLETSEEAKKAYKPADLRAAAAGGNGQDELNKAATAEFKTTILSPEAFQNKLFVADSEDKLQVATNENTTAVVTNARVTEALASQSVKTQETLALIQTTLAGILEGGDPVQVQLSTEVS